MKMYFCITAKTICCGIDSRFRENDEVMNAFMDSIAFGSRMTSLPQVLLLPKASVAGKLACTLPSRRAGNRRLQSTVYRGTFMDSIASLQNDNAFPSLTAPEVSVAAKLALT
jgi:hypothetical protein